MKVFRFKLGKAYGFDYFNNMYAQSNAVIFQEILDKCSRIFRKYWIEVCLNSTVDLK